MKTVASCWLLKALCCSLPNATAKLDILLKNKK